MIISPFPKSLIVWVARLVESDGCDFKSHWYRYVKLVCRDISIRRINKLYGAPIAIVHIIVCRVYIDSNRFYLKVTVVLIYLSQGLRCSKQHHGCQYVSCYDFVVVLV